MYVQYDIQDKAPTKQEIVQALLKMKLGKAPGASGISVEQIRKWHHHARVAEYKCEKAIEIWNKILELITMVFLKGQIPRSFYNGIMVLIKKPQNQGFWGITLLETIYKLILKIIHHRLNATIQLHPSIHRFCT
jgi:hypothetical protein